MDDRTGQQLGNYRLVQLLGSGGFADVYLGKHIHLDSLAAIKLLRANLVKDEMESFRLEARTLVNLIHPHIVRLLDFGLEDTTPYLVMDYAPNGTLRQLHRRGEALRIETVIKYVNQVASALQYAHNQKVIHRDIKPENMLLGRNREILLSDFGIAVVAQSTRVQLTQETIGTIAYMAPEQIQSHPRAASDQYSLAVVAYEWLSGYRPFDGAFTEIAVKHIMVPPPPLRERIPTISPDVEQIIMIALAKEPKQRFGSVQAFATALEQAGRAVRPSAPPPDPAYAQTLFSPAAITPHIEPEQPPIVPASLVGQQAQPQAALPTEAATLMAESAAPHAMATQAVEPAPVINTPRHQSDEQAPAIVTPPHQPVQHLTPAQEKPEPARRGISRRTAIIAGCSAVAVVAAGGLTWAFTPHGSPTTSGQTPGTTTTPAKTSTTSNTGLGAGVLATDNFHRNNQTFWGSASDGQNSWGQDASTSQDFSIVNNTGQLFRTASGHTLYSATLGPNFTDAEIIVTGMISDFTNSHIGAMLRWSDNFHYYKAHIDGNHLNILIRMGNQSPTTPVNFAAQPGTLYTLRFRVVGTTLQAKAWPAANTEPPNWMVTVTDNNFHSGHAGLRPQVNQHVTLQITSFTLKTAAP